MTDEIRPGEHAAGTILVVMHSVHADLVGFVIELKSIHYVLMIIV